MSEWTVEIGTALAVPTPTTIETQRVLAALEKDALVFDPIVSLDAETGVIGGTFQVDAPTMYEAATRGLIAFGGALDLSGLASAVARLVVEVVPPPE